MLQPYMIFLLKNVFVGGTLRQTPLGKLTYSLTGLMEGHFLG